MVFSLTWLPEVLEAAGLKVAETEGWRTRGRGEMGTIRGVICHHTATPGHLDKNMPTLNMLIGGRPGLNGPLAQLGLGRDGTFYVVAAGRANHAGVGQWEGLNTGNSNFIGIEAENDGLNPRNWPEVQMDAYRRGVATILAHVGAGANMCCGHKEYAPGRKIDPTFDMPSFRSKVAELLVGKTPDRPQIKAVDDSGNPTVRRGMRGDAVKRLQQAMGVVADGIFGANTEAALRAIQRTAGIVADGIAGPKTWKAVLGGAAPTPTPAAQPPAAPAQPGAPPPAPAGASTLPVADSSANPARLVGSKGVTPDGREFVSVRKSGFQTLGRTTIGSWIDSLATPPAISDSVIKTLEATSANEGRFEAINSYDACFMSFGILQWTAGQAGGAGELPALLDQLKRLDPAAFTECFGRFGLDVKLTSQTEGLLTLDGKTLDSSAEKQQLRGVTWAYRFWRAGHHDSVRLAQVQWAAQRIRRFIDLPTSGRPLHDWITSERGFAHLFDEHVNRPGHVPETLRRGVEKIGATDPTGWTTADENRLIDAYLAARHARPLKNAQGRTERMTSTVERAAAIDRLVEQGKLSGARGSFQI